MIFNKLSVVELLMGKGYENNVKNSKGTFRITETTNGQVTGDSAEISTEEGLIVHLLKAVQRLSDRLTELEKEYDTLNEDYLFLKSDYDLDRALACSAEDTKKKTTKKKKTKK